MMISLRHKIAQLLIFGFSGCELNDKSHVAHWLMTEGLGGVLLFDLDWKSKRQGKNIQTKDQVIALTHALKTYAQRGPMGSHRVPLWIAIDYEGGQVDRLAQVPGALKTRTPLAQAQLSEDEQRIEFAAMADALKTLGFNLNFAPVVDLSLTQTSGIIGALDRSFSNDPHVVAEVAGRFVDVFQQSGVTCSYKHFPGHGSAQGDTHEGFVDVTDVFDRQELEPYVKLFAAHHAPAMVMTAHVVNRQLDPTGMPATLSYPILTGLLRQQLQFDGVIVSDDLQMNSISQLFALDDVLCQTLNAGADMLIFGNQLGDNDPLDVIDRVESAVQLGKIPTQRIDEAYARVMRLKSSIIRCSRV